MEIDSSIGLMYQSSPELEHSKFGYNYKRFADKNYYNYRKQYQEELVDLRVEYARVDPITQEIMRDDHIKNDRGFSYTKEGMKDVIAAERKLMNKWETKECEIEPRICSPDNVPELSDLQKELFNGVLINVTNEPSEQNKEEVL